MGPKVTAFVLFIRIYHHLALVRMRSSKHGVFGVGVKSHAALGIVAGFDRIDEPEVVEVVNVCSIIQDHHDSAEG